MKITIIKSCWLWGLTINRVIFACLCAPVNVSKAFFLSKTTHLIYDSHETPETQQCQYHHWDGQRERTVILLVALLLLLLSNASEELIVCVESLQDILFQLWQNENTPREQTRRQSVRAGVASASLCVSVCSKTSQQCLKQIDALDSSKTNAFLIKKKTGKLELHVMENRVQIFLILEFTLIHEWGEKKVQKNLLYNSVILGLDFQSLHWKWKTVYVCREENPTILFSFSLWKIRNAPHNVWAAETAAETSD